MSEEDVRYGSTISATGEPPEGQADISEHLNPFGGSEDYSGAQDAPQPYVPAYAPEESGEPGEVPAAPVENRPVPGSLRDRLRKRTEEVEKRTTDIFPVPMYDALLAVELRAISWAKSEAFATKNQRVPTGAMLSTAGDEIIAATVGFFEIKDDGAGDEGGLVLEAVEQPVSWKRLAIDMAGKKLNDMAGERTALIAMCTDQGVVALNTLYRQWLGGASTGLSQVALEVRRDF